MLQNIFLEYFAKFFLLFGQEACYILLIILGFVIVKRQLFAQSVSILFFTMLLNILLKNIFKVPLNPGLNIQSYAFPSGHMISAIAFYGWLFINIRHNILQILIILMLCGLGFSLIYCGYHNLIDIIGSIFFGIAIIIFTNILGKFRLVQKYPFLFGIFLWVLTIPIILYLNIIKISNLTWPWTAFLGLFGFVCSWGLFFKYLNLLQSKLNIFLNLVIVISLIIFIKYMGYLFTQHFGKQFYLSWFLIGFSFPLSVRICHMNKIKQCLYLK